MEKSKRPKNSAQRACLELRRLADWIYSRFLWSVQTMKGTPEPSNQWRHSSNASLTASNSLLPMSIIAFGRRTVDGKKTRRDAPCRPRVARWDSTAPTPTSDASTSTTNLLLDTVGQPMQEHVPLRLLVPLTLGRQGPELDGIIRNGLLPLAEIGQQCCAASRPTSARSNNLLISWESEWNEEQQGWRFSHTAVPHNAALPDSNVSTSATLETSVANVSGWSEKNREHFVRNALQRLGSPHTSPAAGSLGSCWGLWFPGMEKLGGVGGAAGDLNNCTWVVSSDTCATNACTARPVFNIFSSWRSIRALLPANSSCKPRVSAESMKIWSDPSVTMKTGGFSCGKREFITRSNTQWETKRSFP